MIIPISDLHMSGPDVYGLPEVQLLRMHEPQPGLFIAESELVIRRALAQGYEPVSMLMEDKYLGVPAGMLPEAMSGAAAEMLPEAISGAPAGTLPEAMSGAAGGMLPEALSGAPAGKLPEAISGAPAGMPPEALPGTLPGLLAEAFADKPVYVADYETLRSLTGYTLTRGMLCCMRRKRLPEPAELCADMRRIVILESAQNPTNVGALIRSAAALHMDGVVLTKGSADPLYRRAVRVSMGNVFNIPWTMAPEENWTRQTMPALRQLGFRFAAMALQHSSLSIEAEPLRREERLAIVLGTEGDGLRPETIAACDYTVKIPMAENIDSLNVAAAGAIAFWELGRRPAAGSTDGAEYPEGGKSW